MNGLRNRIFQGIFLVLASVSVYAQRFPSPVGHVNDFAQIFNSQERINLENKLREYENKTTIEIAFVSVNSLEGFGVDDYSARLFQAWSIGKRANDNGVLFVVAPNEREMRIEIGYGLEEYLSDGRAGQIMDLFVVPAFKSGDMPKGVFDGVDAIIARLDSAIMSSSSINRDVPVPGGGSVNNAQARPVEMSGEFGFFMLIILAIGGFSVLAFFVLAAFNERKHKKELHLKNVTTLNELRASLEAIESDGLLIMNSFQMLRDSNAQEAWDYLKKEVDGFDDNRYGCLSDIIVLQGLLSADSAHDDHSKIEKLAEPVMDLTSLLKRITNRINEISIARFESNRLFDTLPEVINVLDNPNYGGVGHVDVSEATLDLYNSSRQLYRDANNLLKERLVNWLKVNSVLKEASEGLDKVKSGVLTDIAKAKEAREKGPVLLASLPGLIARSKVSVSRPEVRSGLLNAIKLRELEYEGVRVFQKKNSPPDWRVVYPILLEIEANLEKMILDADSDVADEEARRHKIKNNYSTGFALGGSTSHTRSHSTKSKSSKSSFGGFGGGRSGGGGASRKW